MAILAISVLVLFLVDLLSVLPDRQGKRDVCVTASRERRLPVRWLFWLCLLFFVIIFGEYGPGYSSAAFIYQGF